MSCSWHCAAQGRRYSVATLLSFRYGTGRLGQGVSACTWTRPLSNNNFVIGGHGNRNCGSSANSSGVGEIVARSQLLTPAEKNTFWQNGFVVLPSFLNMSVVDELRHVFPRLFAGQFSTGIYPDEWHWREGISLPSASREICNAWKADHSVRRVILSELIGRLIADLMNWSDGTRIAQDDVLWKPAGGTAVGFHQDSRYISEQFVPYENNSVTLWMALDDADSENGCVEYACGSHRWARHDSRKADNVAQEGFHASSDAYDTPVHRAAEKAGVDRAQVRIAGTAVPAGG
eukprot:scpid75552/ scgid32804/ 